MGKLKNSFEDIDYIPIEWIKDATNVLDIGCGDGRTQIASKYGEWFKEMDAKGKYLGIDADSFPDKVLNNIVYGTNIIDVEATPIFDCVLCINVLEHIPIEEWDAVMDKMRGFTKPGGIVIINTPYKQGTKDYVHKYPPPKGHIVFDIDGGTIASRMDGFLLMDRYINRSNTFDGDGVSFVWAVLRWIKRVITRNPYRKSGRSIMQIYRRLDD
jgi:SAM-dependent methyltransferase